MVEGRGVQGSLFKGEWDAVSDVPKTEDTASREPLDTDGYLLHRAVELIMRINRQGTVQYLHCEGAVVPKKKEYRGKPASDFVGIELAKRLVRQGEDALESGRFQFFDYATSLLHMDLEYEVRLFKSGPDEVTVLIRNVGESRTAQFHLMESENRYRFLLDHSLQGTIVLQDYRIVYVNEALARIAGSSVEELLSITPEELNRRIHPDDRDKVWARFRDRMNNRPVPSNYLFRMIRGDGECRWVETHSTKIEYRGKTAVQASIVDITERKSAEEALLVEKAYLEELFENAPEAIVLVDNDSKVIRVNREFVNTFGYTIEEIRGKSVDDLIAPPDKYEEAARITSRIREGERTCVETVRRRKDGTLIEVSILGNPIVVNGEQVAVYGIYRDITERKSMEEKYRILVENATDAIVIVQDHYITFFNPKAEALIEYSGEELMSRPFIDFIHPDDRDRVLEVYKRWLFDEEPPSTITVRKITKTGKIIWGEINAVRIMWENRPALLCFIRDISTEKRLGAQLQHAQKMEAIGTLAGGVAHDFNNLLQAVLGYADLLLLNRNREDQGYRELQGIRNAALRATDLTQQLLTFSRKIESKLRPINLNNEVKQVRELLGRTIPKMVAIELKLERHLRTVNADPTQVGQALMNLAMNAKDAMPEGGTLTIETENCTLDESFCKSHVGARPGEYVVLSVEDTGSGMDRETRSHIFEPFYTKKTPGTGTGLGLAMVYGIVKSHGGYISCESTRGRGTEFRIYLPVIEEEALPEEEFDETLPQGGAETILLIDDEKLIRDLGEKALTRFGYMVLTAPDGESAVKLFSREWERIDLVILDLIMPKMSGIHCFEEIMGIHPEAKVIIASGYSEEGRVKRSIEEKAAAFISKPFNVKNLLRIIREILDGEHE
jgi:PAS domain S-box-containing protein